ncbi:MAG: fatty acid desaturase [Candidatus Sericytochromatia bacterium]
MKKTIFRYNIDIISVLLVIFIIYISILPIYFELNTFYIIIIVGLLAFAKPITSLIQHNHVHLNIFNYKPLNVIFDLLLAISTGHICSEWILHHNIGHHKSVINSENDTSRVKNLKTGKYMTKMEYILTGSIKIYPECFKIALNFYKEGKKYYLIKFILESIFIISLHIFLLLVNFKMTMFFLLIPNIINRALVWLGAYWNHLEVPSNSIYDSANMYEGPIFNFISFNIGYHVVHHEKPTLHWSKLPERTFQILDKIPRKNILQKLP